MRACGFALVAGMLVSTVAHAANNRAVVDAAGDFHEQKRLIEQALGDGKTYSEITGADRDEVRGALARIEKTLAQANGAAHLNEKQKTEVVNDQELVNTILTRAAADSRLVCRRETKTGSHRATTQCMTMAERERAREHAQDELRRTPSHSLMGE